MKKKGDRYRVGFGRVVLPGTWARCDPVAYGSSAGIPQKGGCRIRCYARWNEACKLLNKDKTGEIYGVEEVVFQAQPNRRDELKQVCDRIDEVRLYTKEL